MDMDEDQEQLVVPEGRESDPFTPAERMNGTTSWVKTAAVSGRELSRIAVYARNITQAHVALLNHEIVSSNSHVEEFRAIRMHFADLEQWHEQHTGWRIQRTSTFFRLERHPHGPVPVSTDEQLKKPRDFACLAWLLWFAEKRYLAGGGRNQQFLLSQLAEEIQEQTRLVSPGKGLDFRNQYDRYSMWHALRFLARLSGVRALEGEVKRWVDDANQPENEVLYEFTSVAHSLIEALHEQQVALLAERLATEPHSLRPAYIPALADPIPALRRAWRSLLLGPALFRYDDPAAFAELARAVDAVSEELAEQYGWLLEFNSDYACIVRGSSISDGSGVSMTFTSATDHMLLLLCSVFRQRVDDGEWLPDMYGCLHVTSGDVAAIFAELRQRYGIHWGATAQTVKATDLLDTIYPQMRQLGLIRGPDTSGELLILPTAARYAISYAEEPAEGRNTAGKASKAGTKAKGTTRRKATPTSPTSPQLPLELAATTEPAEPDM